MTNYQAGMGMTSLGGLVSSIASAMAAVEMRRTLERQLAEQERYAQEAYSKVWQPSLSGWTAQHMQEQVQKGSEQRQAEYQKAGQTPMGSAQTGGKGPTARDQAQFALGGQLRGNNAGYGDWQLERQIANIRTQEQLNQISNFAGGTAQTYPYQMWDAQHSGDALQFGGSALQMGGGLVGGGGFSGGGLFGLQPNTNPRGSAYH